MMLRTASLAALFAMAAACGGDDDTMTDPDPVPFYPADYATTYQEVRNCRFSIDHDLRQMRVLVPPDVVAAYQGRTAPFAEGTIVLKEMYGTDDTTCAGPVEEVVAMRKLAAGSSPDTLDWEWQQIGADEPQAVTRCVSCHTDCGVPPDGWDGTCTRAP